MKFKLFSGLLSSFLLASTHAVSAQDIAYPNERAAELAECVRLSTTGEDRLVAARWMAAAMGAGKTMEGIVAVDPGAKIAADKAMAALFTRLFAQDCRELAAPLIQSGDQRSMQAAGGRLGQIAMAELMADPEVLDSLSAYVRYLDMSEFAPRPGE